jgi:hypothetical protein
LTQGRKITIEKPGKDLGFQFKEEPSCIEEGNQIKNPKASFTPWTPSVIIVIPICGNPDLRNVGHRTQYIFSRRLLPLSLFSSP